MNYNSTRNAALQVTAAPGHRTGYLRGGRPFCSAELPESGLKRHARLDYIGRAEYVLSRFLTDFTPAGD